MLILEPTGIDVDLVAEWILPSGAAGAVIVAAWLGRVVENMAPVLTMLFTPLFALMLAGAAVVYAATGLGEAFDRELLSVFDALLVVVLALVLYGMSARDPASKGREALAAKFFDDVKKTTGVSKTSRRRRATKKKPEDAE